MKGLNVGFNVLESLQHGGSNIFQEKINQK